MSATETTDPRPDVAVSVAEVMTVVLARNLLDKETAMQGFASPLPTAAIRLAREQAPDLHHLSASGALDGTPSTIPVSTEDQRLLEGATAHFTSPEAFDLSAKGKVDVLFIGSPQIDRQGRLNGTAIGDWDDPTVKFGGGGGSGSLLPLVDDVYAWRTEHTERSFPEDVDFVTAAGNLTCVVTPLCVFEKRAGELQVVSLHPGVDRETVQEHTGWDVTVAETGTTDPPTETELELLEAVDPTRTRRSGFRSDQLDPLPE
ncbi:MAG: CoA-transferase subunit beta [Haloarculaceae archaeon]